MWLDLVALGLLVVFGTVGALRGAFKTGMGLLTLLVAYAAAIFFSSALAPAVQSLLGVSDLLALPLAGTVAFFGAFLAMTLVTALLRRVTENGDPLRTPRDRFLGAVFGLVRGGLVVLLVSWLALWLDALRETGTELAIPAVAGSAAATATSAVVERGTLASLGNRPGGRVVARLAARPAVAIGELQRVLDDRSVVALRSDAMFWTYVEHGNVDAAVNRGAFIRVANDASLRGQLADLGLVAPEAAEDRSVFRDEVGEVLRQIGPSLSRLRNDPELHALLEDPQVVAMLQSGDSIGLLAHPGFRGLVDRITSQAEEPAPAP